MRSDGLLGRIGNMITRDTAAFHSAVTAVKFPAGGGNRGTLTLGRS